jgi:hypothetical protein
VSGEGEGGKKITTVLGYRKLHFSHIIYTYTAILLLRGVLKFIIPENCKGILHWKFHYCTSYTLS